MSKVVHLLLLLFLLCVAHATSQQNATMSPTLSPTSLDLNLTTSTPSLAPTSIRTKSPTVENGSNPLGPPEEEPNNLVRLSTLFIPILSLVFLSFALRALSRYSVRQPHQQTVALAAVSEKPSLSKEEIERYSTIFASEVDDSASDVENGNVCAICIDPFEEGEECRRLNCGHAFHKSCIDEWFERSTVCCLCKQDIRTSGDHLEDSTPPAPASTMSTPRLAWTRFLNHRNHHHDPHDL